MPDKAIKAIHYRQRAQELRMIATGIYDEEERKNLIKIAEEYEQLVREMEPK